MINPLIFDFSVSRKKDDLIPNYFYSDKDDLNMININGKSIPFIYSGLRNSELLTKTESGSRESEDDSALFGTITKISREEEDFNYNLSKCNPEFETDTRKAREGNDSTLLELITKTLSYRERDDE